MDRLHPLTNAASIFMTVAHETHSMFKVSGSHTPAVLQQKLQCPATRVNSFVPGTCVQVGVWISVSPGLGCDLSSAGRPQTSCFISGSLSFLICKARTVAFLSLNFSKPQVCPHYVRSGHPPLMVAARVCAGGCWCPQFTERETDPGLGGFPPHCWWIQVRRCGWRAQGPLDLGPSLPSCLLSWTEPQNSVDSLCYATRIPAPAPQSRQRGGTTLPSKWDCVRVPGLSTDTGTGFLLCSHSRPEP